MDKLIPFRPTLALQTPGAFFVGYLFGAKRTVFGPAFGLSGAVAIPLSRPGLEQVESPTTTDYAFTVPGQAKATADLVFSLNVDLAGASAKVNQGASETTKTTLGYSAGGFLGIQIGLLWYDSSVQAKRVLLSLGALVAYLNAGSDIGEGLLVGFQPALIAQF